MADGKLASGVLSFATDLASFGIDPRIVLHADLDSIEGDFLSAIREKLVKDRDIRYENLAIEIGNYVARAMSGE